MVDEFEELEKLTIAIQESLECCVMLAEQEVEDFISQKSTNRAEIQRLLRFLLGVTQLDMGNRLFIRLLDYYKKIDAKDASEFWQRYDENTF